MKKHLILAATLVMGLVAFGNDVGPLVWSTNKMRLLNECSLAPTVGKDWKTHCLGAASVSSVSNYTYTGSAITPTPDVYMGKTKLTVNTDYVYEYTSNTNAGMAIVSVNANRAGYFGGQMVRFRILPRSIVGGSVASIADTNYTGSAICPTPAVTVNSATLVKDRDYILTYDNNVAVGENATVVVHGIGNYSGQLSKTFKIVSGN